MTEKLAKVRPYYKNEVARLYEISLKDLKDWSEDIIDRLVETGYRETQHIYTLKQVEIIFGYLGHPPANNKYETHSNIRVPALPYRKSVLAQIYDVSGKTLINQIHTIPDEVVLRLIMDGRNKNVYQRKRDKQKFKTSEIRLIFQYIGHPYKNEAKVYDKERR